MVEMKSLASTELVEAVRLWTGWGITSYPRRDDTRVTGHFGESVASQILPIIKQPERDFYASDAGMTAKSLEEMARMSSEQFKARHPGVASEIAQAFAWCYTFDHK